jgi:hypothetical protein
VKAILIFAVIVIVVAIVFADYKWRNWMAARRAERDQGGNWNGDRRA